MAGIRLQAIGTQERIQYTFGSLGKYFGKYKRHMCSS